VIVLAPLEAVNTQGFDEPVQPDPGPELVQLKNTNPVAGVATNVTLPVTFEGPQLPEGQLIPPEPTTLPPPVGATATVIDSVGAITTRLELLLVIVLMPQAPVPPVEAAVTVNGVVAAGVEALVVIVRVDVVLLFETVVGLNAGLAPVGAVQLIVKGAEVQELVPNQVVLIE